MDIRDLTYFETIATVGHFGRAAEQLGRTKPALSKCVRRLEAEIGAPLFQRAGRGVVLTPPGKTLLRHARNLRVVMSDALRDIADSAAGSQGPIRLGLGTFIVDDLMPALTDWFRRQPSSLGLVLRTGFNHALRNALNTDQLDGVVSTAQPGDDASFIRQDWFRDEVVVVARAGHPLAGRTGLGVGDMAEYGWVLLENHSASHAWLDSVFQSHGLPLPRARVQIPSYQFMPPFLRGTDLLGFTPRADLSRPDFGAGLIELPSSETTLRRTISFLCRRNAYISPAMLQLVETLRRTAAVLRAADAAPHHARQNGRDRALTAPWPTGDG